MPRNKAEVLNEILKTRKSLTQCILKKAKLDDTLRELGKELGSGFFVHNYDKKTYVLIVDYRHNISVQTAENYERNEDA